MSLPRETKVLEVFVSLGARAVPAGRASLRLRGASLFTEFSYHDDYLADPQAYPLSPALPFQRAAHVVDGLPGAFRDTSPDWWGRNLITRRLRAQAVAGGQAYALVTDLDFLVGVSDRTRQGALRFLDPTCDAFVAAGTGVPQLVDLPDIMAASERIDADGVGSTSQPADQAMNLLLQAGTATLGGARPKASVADQASLAIAKFPHRADQWDVIAWEKTALDLAERAGISVPARRLERIDGRSVLIVDRFDRAPPGEQRLGYISALTLLDAASSAGHDYVDLASAIADHSADADSDLIELWRRMAFSVAVHNTDDHMRNHGFLRAGGGWQLSPAFDLNPNPELGEPRSSSILGAVGVRQELEALYDCASFFGLSARGARVIIDEIGSAVAGWAEAAAGNGIDDVGRGRFARPFEYLLEQLRSR